MSMKIRVESIRDRWLMNIRPFDYEIYVTSGFLLLNTKDEISFLRETGMSKLVLKDANNLLHFIEYFPGVLIYSLGTIALWKS